MADKKPLILDICIPFCIVPEKYAYRLQVVGSNYEKNMYIDALLREINTYKDELEDYTITAVRLSGGAATVMKPDLLGELLARTRNTLPVDPHAEVSFDALPNTIGTPSLAGISAGRPNRAELMIRSESNEELKALGCPFISEDVRNAILFFNRFRLNNLGFTVNYGIPGQTADSFKRTMNFCTGTHPAHISVLPVDDSSAPGAPEKAEQRKMNAMAVEQLEKAGYNHYGRGLFCLPGHENRYECFLHNGTEVLGIGAGAQTYMGGYLIRNTDNVRLYTINSGDFKKITAEVFELDEIVHLNRFVYGRLGMSCGFKFSELEERFGETAKHLDPVFETLRENGWAEFSDEGVTPTQEGFFNYREMEKLFIR